MYDGIGFRLANDALHAGVDTPEEIRTQSSTSHLIPIDGLDWLVLRLRAKKNPHQSEFEIRAFRVLHSIPSEGSSSNRSSLRFNSAV